MSDSGKSMKLAVFNCHVSVVGGRRVDKQNGTTLVLSTKLHRCCALKAEATNHHGRVGLVLDYP